MAEEAWEEIPWTWDDGVLTFELEGESCLYEETEEVSVLHGLNLKVSRQGRDLAKNVKLKLAMRTGSLLLKRQAGNTDALSGSLGSGSLSLGSSAVVPEETDPSNTTTCSLCSSWLVDPVRIPCGHVFCLVCIDQWLLRSRTCSTCRKPCEYPQHTVDRELKQKIDSFVHQLTRSPIPRVAASEVTIGQKIGKGSYAEVYQGRYKNMDCAVKVLVLYEAFEAHTHELELVSQLGHKHIVKIHAMVAESAELKLVMELATRDLGSWYKTLSPAPPSKGGCLGWDDFFTLTESMFAALHYLSRLRCVHLDIKPQNILVFYTPPKTAGGPKSLTFKLCDFNISQFGTQSVQAAGFSMHYCSPEILTSGKGKASSDIFSLASVLIELLRGEAPYKGKMMPQILGLVSSGNFQKAPQDAPKPICTFLDQCLSIKPEDRPKPMEGIFLVETMRHGTRAHNLPWTNCRLDPISRTSTDFDSIRKDFEHISEKAMKYRKRLCITRILRITNNSLETAHRSCSAIRNNPTTSVLYHGTSSWMNIVETGFQIFAQKDAEGNYVRRDGESNLMFGAGVYFTDNALKADCFTQGSHSILACKVALGRTREFEEADYKLDAQEVSRRGFDSVVSNISCEDNARVSEFVVFNTAQALPQYLIFYEAIGFRTAAHFIRQGKREITEISTEEFELSLSSITTNIETVESGVDMPPGILHALSVIGSYLYQNRQNVVEVGQLIQILCNALHSANEVLLWHCYRILSNYCVDTKATEQRAKVLLYFPYSRAVDTLKHPNEAVAQQVVCCLCNVLCGNKDKLPSLLPHIFELIEKATEEVTQIISCFVLRNTAVLEISVQLPTKVVTKLCDLITRIAWKLDWWLEAVIAVGHLCMRNNNTFQNALAELVSGGDPSYYKLLYAKKDDQFFSTDCWIFFWWAFRPTTDCNLITLLPILPDIFYPLLTIQHLVKRNPNLTVDQIRVLVNEAKRVTIHSSASKKLVADILQLLPERNVNQCITKQMRTEWAKTALGSGKVGGATFDGER